MSKRPSITYARWTFALVFAAICLVTTAKAKDLQKLDALCKEAGARIIAGEERPKELSANATVHFSFSTTIRACVWVVADYLANIWVLYDPFGSFTDLKYLFQCTNEGVRNTKLDVVQRLNGHTTSGNFWQWMDDGEGGPWTRIQPPPSRDKCEQLFKKKLAELRLVDEPQW
jgi:hypothetical protein